MIAPCLPLPDRPRPLRLHARPSRSSASSPACPSSPRSNLRPESCFPAVFPTTDPSLSPSLFRPHDLPLDPTPRDLRPLLVPFLPSSWSNVASFHANDPDLNDTSRLSYLPATGSRERRLRLLFRCCPPFLPSFPASRATCYLRG
jgi:hypothetical protein